jgi:hypothetical protein
MYLLYHTFGGLSRVFLKFFNFFSWGVLPPSLNFSYSIPQPTEKVNSFFKKSFRQIAQIREKDRA